MARGKAERSAKSRPRHGPSRGAKAEAAAKSSTKSAKAVAEASRSELSLATQRLKIFDNPRRMQLPLHFDAGQRFQGKQFGPKYLKISNNHAAIVDPNGPSRRPMIFISTILPVARRPASSIPKVERGRRGGPVAVLADGQAANSGLHHFRLQTLPIHRDRPLRRRGDRLYGVIDSGSPTRNSSPAEIFDRRHGLRRWADRWQRTSRTSTSSAS